VRKIISLNDANWRVGSVRQKPFGDVNDLAEVTEWLPAQVPGDVRLDLLRAGKINDPFFADNNEASQWVDARDWWYVRELELEKELELEEELELDRVRAFLVFDGIDYQSAVFWNGKQLGRHVGMFSRQVFELPTKDAGRKTNDAVCNSQLAVRIWGSDALPKLQPHARAKTVGAPRQTTLPAPQRTVPRSVRDLEMSNAIWLGFCAASAHVRHLGRGTHHHHALGVHPRCVDQVSNLKPQTSKGAHTGYLEIRFEFRTKRAGRL
jgi:hypothetical protein